MDVSAKLSLLSDGARYDISCACGDKKLDRRVNLGEGRWLYPVSLPNGGRSIIFKVLLTNACENDCGYCPFRNDANTARCSLSPEQVVKTFLAYNRKMRLAGIFVSSGVLGGADNTMERILDVGRALRGRGYRGYIHLKVIPGASDAAIAETVALADAVSINLEAPGEKRLAKICGAKNYADGIIRPMKTIHRLISEIPTNRKKTHATTQFIVGASDENDYELVRHMDGLYNRLNLHRVYFSAYQRGLGRSDIPGEKRTDNDPGALITREHRLYQADFLMRKYNFGGNEIPMTDDGFLRLDKDPKEVWAETHPDFFPVNLNSAEREELLRVPGLGPKTVAKILRARKSSRLESPEDAGLSGAGLAKAKTYLEPSGKNIFKGFQHDMEQLTLFE